MNSRHKSTETVSSNGTIKKKYCDKQFKRNLVKALKNIRGEPDFVEKLRANKQLQKYSQERIIEYVNTLSADVQRNVDISLQDEEAKEIIELANLMSSITNDKSQEVPLLLKIKAESDEIPDLCSTNNVNFRALISFLYSAVSGLPDFSELDEKTTAVLVSTHQMLLDQIEHDATPEFIEELKSKICAGYTEETHPGVAELSTIFQDKSLNPFNFPFEYLLNGTLPAASNENNKKEPAVVSDNILKTSPKKKS